MENKIESLQSKCANCGGNLYYSPKSHDLFCKNCETHTQIVCDGEIQYHDLNKKPEFSKEYKQYVEQNKIFKCPNCGANVVLNKFEISQVCPYCATSLVANNKNSYGLKPDAIIPFEFDEGEASERFAKAVKKKFFAPRKFKKQIPQNQITGLYIPSFGFNTSTTSSYDGRLYNETTTRDSDGHTHTERHYFHISGNYKSDYKDVMVECSSHITQNELKGFLPFKFKEKKPFNNAFILGYSVEQYDKEINDCLSIYHSELDDLIKRDILRKYSYDGVSYLNVKTERTNETYQYHILPVYKFEYDYKYKKYITYMNGQTGRVDDNVPKSKLKIAMVIFFAILLVLLPILIGILSAING
jgi:Zn finger protein HypA/HybF involved in hydrogenase expression